MRLTDYLDLPYAIILRLDDEGDWTAEIDELEGCAAHGDTQAQALSRLEEAKRLWIHEALENGQPVPKPSASEALPSGKWLQRVPRSLHKNLARLAKVEGVSLNQLVTTILSAHVGINGRGAADVWRELDSAWAPDVQPASGKTIFFLRELTGRLPDRTDLNLKDVSEEPRGHDHAGRR
jgi:antitoxin HicB